MPRYAAGTIMKRGAPYTLKTSAAETASTTGGSVEVGDAAVAHVEVNVTAASGTTPTMTVVIEGSNDNVNWYTLATIGANGASLGGAGGAPSNFTAAALVRAAAPLSQFVRYRSVIAGTTPSFTYSVIAETSTGFFGA